MEKKYQTVIDFIKREIAAKNLKPGSKLPSILEVSQRLQCNKDTVIRAYHELGKEHIAYAVPKSGYYLISKTERQKCVPETDCIDFWPHIYSSKVVPDTELHHCLNQSINLYKDRLLTVNDVSGGIVSLRRTIQKQLQDLQVFTPSENIFITTGSQQSLSILADIPLPNGKKKVLVEQPVGSEILNALKLINAVPIGIERNSDGIDLDKLAHIFQNEDVKFFYTMPRLHNPTGYSISSEQKKKILQLAQKYNVYLVEDDCFAELDLNKKADPLFSDDHSSRVFYLKSYSKILFPWLRLGIMVCPSVLSDLFKGMKICNNIIEQGALELYIKNGMYEKHLTKIKQSCRSKMNAFQKACDQYLDSRLKTRIPNTGYFTCIELPVHIQAYALANSLKLRNLRIATPDSFFLSGFQKLDRIFLNLRNVDEKEIEQGIKILAEEIGKITLTGYSGIGTSQFN